MTLRNLQIVRSGASEVSAPHAFSKPINHHQARQKLTKHHACTNVNQRRPAVLSVETPLPSELDALCWHATVATNSANCCVVVSFFRTRGDCRVGFRLCPVCTRQRECVFTKENGLHHSVENLTSTLTKSPCDEPPTMCAVHNPGAPACKRDNSGTQRQQQQPGTPKGASMTHTQERPPITNEFPPTNTTNKAGAH